jgi:glycine/D-amino acid oxidase-like deaminating enzyme
MSFVPPQMPPSHWVAVTPKTDSFSSLAGHHETDVLVIGAGFTGLSTALHLREKGVAVSVIEAVEPGYGASGRNNGQVIPTLSRLDPDDLVQKHGEAGDRFANLVRDSASQLFDMVRKYDLKAEAEQTGWVQPVHSPGRMRIAEKRVRQWEKRGAPVQLLSKDAVSQMTGSSLWHGGWTNTSGGHINPLALAREMARKLAELGGDVFIHSPVERYERIGSRWIVTTQNGTVSARALVLATHSYSDAFSKVLNPEIAREVVPVLSWQMVTQPLGHNLRASIIPGRQAISDTHGDLYFMRYDARHRLITGGALVTAVNGPERLKNRISARLQSIYPQMGDVTFSHVWNGYIGMTDDYAPRIHQLGPDAFAWAGCNGRGVALSVALGREFAAAVTGVALEKLALPLTDIKPLAFHGIIKRVAPLMLMEYRRRDMMEV